LRWPEGRRDGQSGVAVHMTWGAINEWCTHAGVDRLPGLKGLGLIRRATAGLTDAAGSPTRLAVDADAA
jgi:hypothetical protein